jgi:hypothetical protein
MQAICCSDIIIKKWTAESIIMTGQPDKQPSTAKKPKPTQKDKNHVNKLLDEALDETFPASDPVAMTEPVPNSKRSDDDERKQP